MHLTFPCAQNVNKKILHPQKQNVGIGGVGVILLKYIKNE